MGRDARRHTMICGLLMAASLTGCSTPGMRTALKTPRVGSSRPPVARTAGDRVTREVAVRDREVAHFRLRDVESLPDDDIASIAIIQTAGTDEGEMITLPEHLTLQAATDPFGRSALALADLQQLALTHNPTLRQAAGLVQQAQGNWLQVGLYPNPVFGYDGGANNAPFDGQSLFLSQNIVTGGKLDWSRDVATRDTERAQWDAKAQTLRVVNDIRIRFIAVLGAQRRLTVTSELLRFADDGVRLVETLFQEEQITKADVLQARVQQSQTRILVRNAEYQLTAAWKQLAVALGCPDLPMQALEGEIEDAVPTIDRDGAWSQICHASPALQAARARAAASASQVRREQVERIPDLQVTGSVGRDFASPQFMMYGLQIGVELPVFDRNQGNVTAATGELRAAQAEVRRLELALQDRLTVAFQKYESARTEAETYRETILPTAKDNLALTQRGYEEGELDFLRVLTARRDLSESTMNYVASLIELRTSAVEIDGMLLTGGLDAVESNPVSSNSAGQTSGAGR